MKKSSLEIIVLVSLLGVTTVCNAYCVYRLSTGNLEPAERKKYLACLGVSGASTFVGAVYSQARRIEERDRIFQKPYNKPREYT